MTFMDGGEFRAAYPEFGEVAAMAAAIVETDDITFGQATGCSGDELKRFRHRTFSYIDLHVGRSMDIFRYSHEEFRAGSGFTAPMAAGVPCPVDDWAWDEVPEVMPDHPILLAIGSTGRSSTAAPERKWYSYVEIQYQLVVPIRGETWQEKERRERREYAASVRTELEQLGATDTEVRALFTQSGVGNSVDALKLGIEALTVAGGDHKRAWLILARELHAPYGRARMSEALSDQGIYGACTRTAKHQTKLLRGAIRWLGWNPDEVPPPKPRVRRPVGPAWTSQSKHY